MVLRAWSLTPCEDRLASPAVSPSNQGHRGVTWGTARPGADCAETRSGFRSGRNEQSAISWVIQLLLLVVCFSVKLGFKPGVWVLSPRLVLQLRGPAGKEGHGTRRHSSTGGRGQAVRLEPQGSSTAPLLGAGRELQSRAARAVPN